MFLIVLCLLMFLIVLCFLDCYNKASCNDELYLVKGGPASGSIILIFSYCTIT